MENKNLEKNVLYSQDLTRDPEEYTSSIEKRCSEEDCYNYSYGSFQNENISYCSN